MMRLNLRRRILIATLLPTALLALALASFFIIGRVNDLEAAQSARVWALTRQVAAASEYGIFSGNHQALDTLVRAAKREAEVRAVSIFDSKGRIVARAGEIVITSSALQAVEAAEIVSANSRLVVLPIQGSELPLDEIFATGGEPARPPLLGSVALEFSLESKIVRERELLLAGILLTLGGLLFGSVLAWYLSRSVILPLLEVSEVVARIGTGELSARVTDASDELLPNLAQGVNLMAARIQDSQDEMQRRIADATADLRRSREDYRLIAAQQSAILDTDLFGIAAVKNRTISWANPGFEKIIGYAPGEAVGQPARPHYLNEETYLAVGAEAARIFDGGGSFRTQVEHLRRDGSSIWVEISAAMLNPDSGESLWAFVDVTEARRSEAELLAARRAAESASQAKTRFLAAASHDLWQPIQAINLFHDALLKADLNENQKLLSAKLAQSVHSLSDILSVLVDISRLDSGTIEPRPDRLPADELFYWIDAVFSPIALAKKLRFKLHFPMADLDLCADVVLLHSLLSNLISNAIRYTERGGVLVGIRRHGGRALIQVWDSGIGIAPEHSIDIFEEYFQVHNPERDRNKGLGLGLSIVKRVARLLDTEVTCRSRPERGTVFEFSLPLARAVPEPD